MRAKTKKVLAVQINMQMSAPDDGTDIEAFMLHIREGIVVGLGKRSKSPVRVTGIGSYAVEVIGTWTSSPDVPGYGTLKLRNDGKRPLSALAKKCGFHIQEADCEAGVAPALEARNE